MTTVGILYHPQLAAARELADKLAERLRSQGMHVWLTAAYREDGVRDQLATTDFLVGLGGDGTILRATKTVLPRAVPILGVNFGRLGFLAELQPYNALDRIPELLAGQGRVEDRTMIEAVIHRPHLAERVDAAQSHGMDGPYAALNDVVVARYAPGRPIYVEVSVHGQLLNTYRCDGIIVSTATGSTGYNLSAGGPVLSPDSHCMVLTPVAAHLSLANSLVLDPASVVDLRVHTDHQAVLSVDGQLDFQLHEGDHVVIQRSPHIARFLRSGPAGQFYQHLMDRLR